MATPTTNISTPTKGMVTDLHQLNFDGTMYAYALNANIADITGQEFFLQNDGSNVLKTVFPKDTKVIGLKFIMELNFTVFALLNTVTGESSFGIVKNVPYTESSDTLGYTLFDGSQNKITSEEKPLEEQIQLPYATYENIIASDCLGFNINNPVIIEYRITECGVNLYFTDNLNPRRYLYLDYDSNGNLKVKQDLYKVLTDSEGNTVFDPNNCNLPIYTTELDCNKISYHPCFAKPKIFFTDTQSGGQLEAGVYQFLVAYTDVNGRELTNYFPASNTIPIFERAITTQTNYRTGKAIVLELDNVDNQTFLHYNLVVVRTIDNATDYKLIGTYPTFFNQTVTHTYTGFEQDLKSLSATDVFFRRPYYSTAKVVSKANNYLFFGGLKEYKQLNLQRVANNIQLYWQTIAIDEKSYDEPRNTFYFRTYQRDEVYAFGIVFEFCDGWETCAYHIPGNSADYYVSHSQLNPLDILPDSNPDVINEASCANSKLNRRWQVYNTAFVVPNMCEYKFTQDCKKASCWEAGIFGYYESLELYPNDPLVWGDLCGKPVRFHKFPDSSVSHIHDGLCGSKQYAESNIIHPIGIRIDHNSIKDSLIQAIEAGVITLEDANKITGYRIVRSNRSGQKSIIAKGLLYDMWSYEKASPNQAQASAKTYYYPNYPYNDLTPDYFLAPNDSTYNPSILAPNTNPPKPSSFKASGRYTFHSPDTHFTNPTLGTILKLETVEYGKSSGFFNESLEEAKYKRLSYFARLIAFGIGVAAALSAIEEKECTTYTIKGDSKSEFPIVSGNLAGFGTTSSGPLSTLNTDYSDYPRREFNKNTGLSGPVISAGAYSIIPVSTAIGKPVETFTKTTCTGTLNQLLSPLNAQNATVTALKVVISGLATGAGLALQVLNKTIIGLQEMNLILDLMTSLIPEKNYMIQYNSVGFYNNFTPVPNYLGGATNGSGIKQRSLERSAYLLPNIQSINDLLTVPNASVSLVNNWNRESSVYLKIPNASLFLTPNEINPCVKADNSRVTAGNKGMDFSYKKALNNSFERDIASYYASIKVFNPTQYGKVYNINYLETNSTTFKLAETSTPASEYTVFGGDTFINRFALKRKHPFFLQTRFRMTNGSDVKYSELGNAAFPNFFFDTSEGLLGNIEDNGNLLTLLNPINLIGTVIGVEDSRLDCRTANLFYQKGYIYYASYGVPYFLVESDINTDFRTGENSTTRDFYPNNANLQDWFQEKNVPLITDNFYAYNSTYSKQNTESFICTVSTQFNPNECEIRRPNRVIYSEPQEDVAYQFDNWRVFLANSYYDFPTSDGPLIGLTNIESDKMIARLENITKLFAAYNVIQATGENIQVDTGGLFQTRPQSFASTTLGYTGSQHRDMLQTEFGYIWVDAKRANIFKLSTGGQGLEELTKNGMKTWFNQNLPFQILKDFPTLSQSDLDNNFKGLGITMAFDRRFSRVFITKLDYTCINKQVTYDATNKKFIAGTTEVSLKDKKYFCDKSFTISYNFLTQSWTSFHSFKPLYYNYFIDSFDTGIEGSMHAHNQTNRSYQVYYGKLEPFIVESTSKMGIETNVVNSFEYVLDTIRYNNTYDYFYNDNVNFNKAIVYNERQNSGLLELVAQDSSNLSQLGNYPKSYPNRTEILATKLEDRWMFNNFYNLANEGIPSFIQNCSVDTKELNPNALNYLKPDIDKARIRAKQCRVRLINDKYSNYKFIFNFIQNNQAPSN